MIAKMLQKRYYHLVTCLDKDSNFKVETPPLSSKAAKKKNNNNNIRMNQFMPAAELN